MHMCWRRQQHYGRPRTGSGIDRGGLKCRSGQSRWGGEEEEEWSMWAVGHEGSAGRLWAWASGMLPTSSSVNIWWSCSKNTNKGI